MRRGLQWLASRQRSDGGWAPRDGRGRKHLGHGAGACCCPPICPQAGPTTCIPVASGANRARIRVWCTGCGFASWGCAWIPTEQFDGWPWYPGTAAWVAPTALSILALRKTRTVPQRDAQIEEAHGRRDSRFFWRGAAGTEAGTMARPRLSAMIPIPIRRRPASHCWRCTVHQPSEMGSAVEVAERHLRESQSLEATSWLTLGLLAHGRSPSAVSVMPHQGTVATRTGRAGRSRASRGETCLSASPRPDAPAVGRGSRWNGGPGRLQPHARPVSLPRFRSCVRQSIPKICTT